ncbi:DUF3826 domain-containing protein [Larkinella ripae]
MGQPLGAKTEGDAYSKTVNERAAKIVATLGLADSVKAVRVQGKIAQQYRSLNTIHEARKEALKTLKETADTNALESGKSRLDAQMAEALKKLHADYLLALQDDLTAVQIDQVKDGMTYGVLPVTLKGYQAMLPDLTSDQKEQIRAYLTEARERAMDEGTANEKHAVFGKYKGRINNYLSAAGIDMKKASKAWEARIAQEAKSRQEKE